MTGWIALASLVVIVVYFIVLYNHLVNIKHGVNKAWANIDVLLKQRHDELPKLVETCRQYMKFEQDTLEKVMQARAQVSAARSHRTYLHSAVRKARCVSGLAIYSQSPRTTPT